MDVLRCVLFLVLLNLIAARSTTVKYVGLRQLGKYSGVNEEGVSYEKTFYVSSYLKLTPPQARSFCKTFGLDLISFESRSEFLMVREKFEPELPRDKNIFLAIGGFAHADSNGKSYFYWITSGIKTFSNLEAINQEMCMGIRNGLTEVALATISCYEPLKFVCQEVEIQYAN